jgi:hypothetical protein
MAGNWWCYALQNMLKSKTLSRKAKPNVCKTIIRPVVTMVAKPGLLLKKIWVRDHVWKEDTQKSIWTSKRQTDVENKIK